jgi:hypothetical protein
VQDLLSTELQSEDATVTQQCPRMTLSESGTVT